MADRHRFARARIGLATAAIGSFGAAAAVGWAAATPLGTTAKPPVVLPRATDTTATARQLAAAEASLQRVRRDIAVLLTGEDDLPRAVLPNLPVISLPTVQVPAAVALAPAPAVQPAAPVTHTTTGASGAVPR